MASSSLSCSSASTATQATDLQDSDDSGVDLKPQIFLQRFSNLEHESSGGRRNKRKSSEPRKRKDVLLMKRFRWDDTDDEDNRVEEDNDDVFDALEGERPSSGDSGYREAVETPALTRLPAGSKKKTRPRQWRKPKTETVVPEEEGNPPPLQTTLFRQSVICKNEASTTPPCTSTTTLHRGTPTASTVTSAKVDLDPKHFADSSGGLLTSDHDVSDDPESGRSVGSRCRPRNYKSMSRQRRIEANARERTRVHTISAAFESLRRAVPAYAHNQKLSKLAILRIASAYIVALACLNGSEGTPSSMSECVEGCTRTIQAEGRSRRRTPSTKD